MATPESPCPSVDSEEDAATDNGQLQPPTEPRPVTQTPDEAFSALSINTAQPPSFNPNPATSLPSPALSPPVLFSHLPHVAVPMPLPSPSLSPSSSSSLTPPLSPALGVAAVPLVSVTWGYGGAGAAVYLPTELSLALPPTPSSNAFQQQMQMAMDSLHLRPPLGAAHIHSTAHALQGASWAESMALHEQQRELFQQQLQLQQQQQQLELHRQRLQHQQHYQQQRVYHVAQHYWQQQQQQQRAAEQAAHSLNPAPAPQQLSPADSNLASPLHPDLAFHYQPHGTAAIPISAAVSHLLPYGDGQHYPHTGYEAFLQSSQPQQAWPHLPPSTYSLPSYPTAANPLSPLSSSSPSPTSSSSFSSSPPSLPFPHSLTPPANAKLIVRYLPPSLTPTQFHRSFASLGPTLLSSNLIFHRIHRTSLGYGFLQYPSQKDARRVQSLMNGTVMEGGRPIMVQECKVGPGGGRGWRRRGRARRRRGTGGEWGAQADGEDGGVEGGDGGGGQGPV